MGQCPTLAAGITAPPSLSAHGQQDDTHKPGGPRAPCAQERGAARGKRSAQAPAPEPTADKRDAAGRTRSGPTGARCAASGGRGRLALPLPPTEIVSASRAAGERPRGVGWGEGCRGEGRAAACRVLQAIGDPAGQKPVAPAKQRAGRARARRLEVEPSGVRPCVYLVAMANVQTSAPARRRRRRARGGVCP